MPQWDLFVRGNSTQGETGMWYFTEMLFKYSSLLIYQIHFTVQNLHLLEVLAEAFCCYMHHFQCFGEARFPVHVGWDSGAVSVAGMFNCAHTNISAIPTNMNWKTSLTRASSIGTAKHCKWYRWHQKASANTWVSEDFAEWCESSDIIRSRCTKCQN